MRDSIHPVEDIGHSFTDRSRPRQKKLQLKVTSSYPYEIRIKTSDFTSGLPALRPEGESDTRPSPANAEATARRTSGRAF
jgi:hypothetical protein